MVSADRVCGQEIRSFFCRGLIGQAPSLLCQPDPESLIPSVARRKTPGRHPVTGSQPSWPYQQGSKSLRQAYKSGWSCFPLQQCWKLSQATERDREQVWGSSAQKDCPHHFLFCPSAEENPTELCARTFPTDRCERRNENSGGVGAPSSLQLPPSSASARGCEERGTKWAREMSEQPSSPPHSLPSPLLCLLLGTSATFLPPCLHEDSYSTFKPLFVHPLTQEIPLFAW